MKQNRSKFVPKSSRLKFAEGGAVDDDEDIVSSLRRRAEESRRVMALPTPRWQQIQEERARQNAENATGAMNPRVYRQPGSPPRPLETLSDSDIRRYLTALEAEQGAVAPRLNVGRATIPVSSPYTARDLRLELARRQPASPRRAPFEGEPGYSEPPQQARPAARTEVERPAPRIRTSDAAEQPAMPAPRQAEQQAQPERPRQQPSEQRSRPRAQPARESEADQLNAISQAFIRGERPRGGAADTIGKALGIEGYKKGGLIKPKAAAKPVKKAAGGVIPKAKKAPMPKVPGRKPGRPAAMGKPAKPMMPAFKKGGKVSMRKGKK